MKRKIVNDNDAIKESKEEATENSRSEELFIQFKQAVADANWALIEILIDDVDFNVNAADEKTDETPLHLLTSMNDIELKLHQLDKKIVSLIIKLIKKGADVNVSDETEATPLYNATLNNLIAVSNYLLSVNADMYFEAENSRSPFAISQDLSLSSHEMQRLFLSFQAGESIITAPLVFASSIHLTLRVVRGGSAEENEGFSPGPGPK